MIAPTAWITRDSDIVPGHTKPTHPVASGRATDPPHSSLSKLSSMPLAFQLAPESLRPPFGFLHPLSSGGPVE